MNPKVRGWFRKTNKIDKKKIINFIQRIVYKNFNFGD